MAKNSYKKTSNHMKTNYLILAILFIAQMSPIGIFMYFGILPAILSEIAVNIISWFVIKHYWPRFFDFITVRNRNNY